VLRLQLPHQALAVLYGVDRAIITRTVGEIRPPQVDTGYRGLAKAFPGQLCALPLSPAKIAPAEQVAAYQQARTRQSSRRICVEHAIAEHKQWRPLQRYLGRREAYAETYLAIVGLVSDRAARR
jgi:hypothetical protein